MISDLSVTGKFKVQGDSVNVFLHRDGIFAL